MPESKYYAHTKEENVWQLLQDHLENTAGIAMGFADIFDAGAWGKIAGLLHDLGKYNPLFQERLHGKNIRVDHSTAGAKYANDKIKIPTGAGKLIAYCVAGHHTGLPDGCSGEDDSCLIKRLERCSKLYSAFVAALPLLPKPAFIKTPEKQKNNRNTGFSIAFFIRMLFSCLVDADFLDTEAFFYPDHSKIRGQYPDLKALNHLLVSHLRELNTKAQPAVINQFRRRILEECCAAAVEKSGIFSLTVPTGGGKTLSSLAFAINHALHPGNNFSRIIYVIPYTSIIEQTARVFRSIFGNEAVLEHHSHVGVDKSTGDEEADLKRQLASENWDAPIIVTTNVQFFESFFSNRSSKTRKLHNIARSVVILDEAQMLPVPFLKPTLEVIRELTENYHATVVLCTATQPALTYRDDFESGLTGVREIISTPEELEKVFARVIPGYLGVCSDKKLTRRLEKEKAALCIVNTKGQARNIYNALSKNKGNYHLSAAMCPVHRSRVLAEIRDKLKAGMVCRVVSTQLVEAGVDLDFPVVFRALAGVDSIVQAAGRCNREGKLPGMGKLYVFAPADGLPPGYLRQTAQITQTLIAGKEAQILNKETCEAYFRELYWLKDKNNGLDSKDILGRLQTGIGKGDFPFKTIAEEYKIIDDAQLPVIIPFDEEAMALCADLKRFIQQGWSAGKILRKLQPYIVQVYPKTRQVLVQCGYAEVLDEYVYLLTELGRKEAYNDEYGLNPALKEFFDAENLIM